MVILGVDPGVATVGYGVIEIKGNRLSYIGHGTIQTSSKKMLPARLLEIFNEMNRLITKHRPGLMGVEQLFFAKNVKTAMMVSQARGVILLAGEKQGVRVEEYTPLKVKSTLTGYGQADKSQIQKMVKALLGLPEIPKPDDAADALAIALTALQHHTFNELRLMEEESKK